MLKIALFSHKDIKILLTVKKKYAHVAVIVTLYIYR